MRRNLLHVICVLMFLLGTVSCASTKQAGDPMRGISSMKDSETGEVLELTDDMKMPTFHGGGVAAFRSWVMQRIQYPPSDAENYIQGRVTARFVVGTDGKISDIEILSSPSVNMSDEVRRLLRSAPKWTPGEKDGEKVRVRLTMPVDFKFH